jgi:predicted cupin superfamily sugar epimerase
MFREIYTGVYIMYQAKDWIEKLGLQRNNLGGFFKVTSTSNEITLNTALPERFHGDRQYYSTNYYLLESSEVLSLHHLNQDELWFFHTGSTIIIHIFSNLGKYQCVRLGIDIDRNESLHLIAPHNHWFGAELAASDTFVLASCSLSPGFDPRDSKLPTKDEIISLKKLFPEQGTLIDRLTRLINNA